MSEDGAVVRSPRERERPYDVSTCGLAESRGRLAARRCLLTDMGLVAPILSTTFSLLSLVSSASSSSTPRSLSLEVDSSLDSDSTSVDDEWLMEEDFLDGGDGGGRSSDSDGGWGRSKD